MVIKIFLTLFLLVNVLLMGLTVERDGKGSGGDKGNRKGKDRSAAKKQRPVTEGERSEQKEEIRRKGRWLESDAHCARVGGICQRNTYVCPGRYLSNKCTGPRTRQCCTQGSGAWDVLCVGHQKNRVRGCDQFGCGAYNSERAGGKRKAVDVVCDDYGAVSAPFSGTLGGPVWRKGRGGERYDGVKLFNSEHCVEIYNIRPQRYLGRVTKGEALGYQLPLQERFSGIASHLELRMCDGSDPTPFI